MAANAAASDSPLRARDRAQLIVSDLPGLGDSAKVSAFNECFRALFAALQ
jgi:hypothetical protein